MIPSLIKIKILSLREEMFPLGSNGLMGEKDRPGFLSTDLLVVAAVEEEDTGPQPPVDDGEYPVEVKVLLVLRQRPQHPVRVHERHDDEVGSL